MFTCSASEAAANPATGAVRRACLASFYSEEQGDKGAPTAFAAIARSNAAKQSSLLAMTLDCRSNNDGSGLALSPRDR
jgi:hypothetical protein